MERLTDKQLIEAYQTAIRLKLDNEFIFLLKEALIEREIK
ncbi:MULTISPECIES: sporulation histidine kinase inhibitor Sda [Paraliobacillus]|nr:MULTISPECIES: sporulation histidine kinase inhibitor Sda [Paraliobacillus]